VTAERRDPRSRAREAALQMLYQWEVGRGELDDTLTTYWEVAGASASAAVRELAATLARGTVRYLDELDALITDAAEHWRLERMAVVDRLILRLAVYELRHTPDTPPKVAINEALELARRFSTDDAVKFVNGVLDAIRKRLVAESVRAED